MKLKDIKGYYITHKGVIKDEKKYGEKGKTLEMISVGNIIVWRFRD